MKRRKRSLAPSFERAAASNRPQPVRAAARKPRRKPRHHGVQKQPAAPAKPCAQDFGAAAEAERRFLGDLEEVLQRIAALHCAGPAPQQTRELRVTRLLLTLFNGNRPYHGSRFCKELERLAGRRHPRAEKSLRTRRAPACRPAPLHARHPEYRA